MLVHNLCNCTYIHVYAHYCNKHINMIKNNIYVIICDNSFVYTYTIYKVNVLFHTIQKYVNVKYNSNKMKVCSLVNLTIR